MISLLQIVNTLVACCQHICCKFTVKTFHTQTCCKLFQQVVTSLQVTSLILTNLLQLVDKLQQAGKIDNLQQVGGVFGCVIRYPFLLKYFKTLTIRLPKAALDHCEDHNIKPASSKLIAQAILTIDNGIVSSFCAHVTNTFSRR